MRELKPKYFKTRSSFRKWLSVNHNKKNELWLLFYKKHTNKTCIGYSEAVEEALCFGWIDGILKRLDEDTYKQRFTPRRPKSIWSLVNKKRVLKLIELNQMTETGLVKIKEAKKSGEWARAYTSRDNQNISAEFLKALDKNPKANHIFNSLIRSRQYQFIFWINSAKKQETKLNRISSAIEKLLQKKNLGWFE